MASPNTNIQGYRFDNSKPAPETISERAHRHLRDEKSVITDDDIRNARMVLDIHRNYYEDFLAGIIPPSVQ